jgi:hypothetical protein
MKKPTENTLPSPSSTPSFPIPFLTPQSSQSEITQSDIDTINMAAVNLYKQWCSVDMTINELARLFKFTTDFSKHRRAIMEMPYGVKETTKTKRFIVEPVD